MSDASNKTDAETTNTESFIVSLFKSKSLKEWKGRVVDGDEICRDEEDRGEAGGENEWKGRGVASDGRSGGRRPESRYA